MAPTLIGLLWGSDGPFYLKCSDVGLARSKHNRRVTYWGRRQFANKTVKEKMKDTTERGLDPGQPVTGSHASAEALWKMLLLTLLAENLTLKPAIRIPFCCQSQTTSGYKSKETSTFKFFHFWMLESFVGDWGWKPLPVRARSARAPADRAGRESADGTTGTQAINARTVTWNGVICLRREAN